MSDFLYAAPKLVAVVTAMSPSSALHMKKIILRQCSKNLIYDVLERAPQKLFPQSARSNFGETLPEFACVARYDALIRAKSHVNCDAHLTESLFQTGSSKTFLNGYFVSRETFWKLSIELYMCIMFSGKISIN